MADRKPTLRQRLRSAIDDRVYGPRDVETAVPFRDVLHAELRLIRARRAGRRERLAGGAGSQVAKLVGAPAPPEEDSPAESDRAAFRRALDEDLCGLAFSGGGIRSATFNLGIVQGLSDLGLLAAFDYLSTVSGGGYIGSWLTALIDRENRQKPPADPCAPHGVFRVQERLRSDRPGPEPEDPAVTFLRRYSNYLTPRVGLLSADTWAMIATYLRNLLLNLCLLIPGLAGLLLLPRWVAVAHAEVDTLELLWLYPPLSLVLSIGATVMMGYSMASYAGTAADRSQAPADPWLAQGRIQRLLVLPLVGSAFLASQWLIAHHGAAPLMWSIWVALAYAGAWVLALAVALRSRWSASQPLLQWGLLCLMAAVAGAVVAPLLWSIAGLLGTVHAWHGYVWGTPMVILWFVVLGVIQTGLMGRELHDSQREWLSRLGAWLLIYAAGWSAAFALIVYGPVMIFAAGGWVQAALASGWLASTIAGLLASRGGEAGKLRRLVMAVAPYVFVVGLLALLAVVLDWCLSRLVDAGATWTIFMAGSGGDLGELLAAHLKLLDATGGHAVSVFVVMVLLLSIGGFLAWRIDVNEFSMHRFYRNRLVRCFLGASVPPAERRRNRQPFTGFYHGDDIRLRGTVVRGDRDGLLVTEQGPYPLINTALNLVAGEELAWQQRKAASFLFSPLYCGFDVGRRESEEATERDIEAHGYHRTHHFGSHPVPLTLGSAFAISGAAASPNMGFRSTPAFAFLLTVFNVRLGWWLGNPRHRRTWTRSGPLFAWLHLFMEVFGKTRARTRYVYLSDGGHFENLGIYELVRRRCRYIVACDAGADPGLGFDDLGNALRKCRADLGVDIDIQLDPIRAGDHGLSAWHCAVGTIHYGGDGHQRDRGVLLYIKASLTGDEPEDVRNYARDNPDFPHQSTADQFFDESQFESYRRLGHHVATAVLSRAVERASEEVELPATDEVPARTLRRVQGEPMWLALQQQWLAPSRTEAFSRHAEKLEELFERLRTAPELAFLDAQIYPEWRAFLGTDEPPPPARASPLWLPQEEDERRQGFYFCNALIQLMETVYLDLELDRDYGHPDNRGWMNLFKHWSWSGVFRVTWAISASTVGHRFQTFCEQRLGLELGVVDATDLPLPAGHRGPIDAAVFRAAVAAADGHRFFNFLEREHLGLFLAEQRDVGRILQLELIVRGAAVDGGEVPELLRFGFGYAVLDQEGEIVLFRVQDHLRSIGLGRAAVRRIVGEAPAVPSAVQARGGARDRFVAELSSGRRRFAGLVASVGRELEEDRARERLIAGIEGAEEA